VSCSVHDLVRLERLGVATAGVGTEPFADEALEQAALLGMPGYRMVWVTHPVQLLTAEELDVRVDAAMAPILARLLADSSSANIS
jgi:hypothetical protein